MTRPRGLGRRAGVSALGAAKGYPAPNTGGPPWWRDRPVRIAGQWVHRIPIPVRDARVGGKHRALQRPLDTQGPVVRRDQATDPPEVPGGHVVTQTLHQSRNGSGGHLRQPRPDPTDHRFQQPGEGDLCARHPRDPDAPATAAVRSTIATGSTFEFIQSGTTVTGSRPASWPSTSKLVDPDPSTIPARRVITGRFDRDSSCSTSHQESRCSDNSSGSQSGTKPDT